ncbi:hypothetical protein EPD60_12350 [Flaviaesturariibacter flavus]|uniref:Uncharacterized protein n=1 Tax=Flaviaesturariibacter flavus TaxID=2502780 RepID=A0A4V2NVH9_9BACT|nr:hypothetical protein [Flaviaesturariibacter flavus]TCJ13582.1 hypothetical protein EPD60_12350 [Flaviaesturariibacter flavus]
MKRCFLPFFLALCALPAAGQTLDDVLTALFALRREPNELYAALVRNGYRAVGARKDYRAFTDGRDSFVLRTVKGKVVSLRYSTGNVKAYEEKTKDWTLLGSDAHATGKVIETGVGNIYWIFGIRYPRRVTYTIIESADYSKKIEDGFIE